MGMMAGIGGAVVWLGLATQPTVLLAASIVATGAVGGDVAIEGYPDSWPAPMQHDDDACVSLSGEYRYFGEGEDLHSRNAVPNPSFEGVAFRRNSIRANMQASVHLQHEVAVGKLIVRVYENNKEEVRTPSAVYTEDVECKDGWTRIKSSARGYVDGTETYGTRQVALSRAQDGELIVFLSYEVESRHLLLFKVRRKGKTWYRFFPSSRVAE